MCVGLGGGGGGGVSVNVSIYVTACTSVHEGVHMCIVLTSVCVNE